MKDKKLYEVGNLLWRTTDNALFEITQINLDQVDLDGKSISSYVLKCVNNMNVAERFVDSEPETEFAVNIDMVHAEGSIYTPYQPSKPKTGQHVWNRYITEHNNEFIVEAIKDIPGSSRQDIPCKSCHNGVCEQCHWGYRSEEDIAKEIRSTYKKPETIYTMVSIDGREQYRANDDNFDQTWSMLPPFYEITKHLETSPIINSDDEAEKVMNERLDKESVCTGETIEDDSYTRWKNGLKVVNVPKFDLKYFQRGMAYHVQKRGYGDGEFYGILFEATENLLRFMRIGPQINSDSTEIVDVELKDYMDGMCSLVRMIEEV